MSFLELPENAQHTSRWYLARRLLIQVRALVQYSVRYSLVIYAIGCVVPTPIDVVSTPPNLPPVFVTGQVDPPFGPLINPQNDKTFTLVALDPNASDPNAGDLTLELAVRKEGASEPVPEPGTTPFTALQTVPNDEVEKLYRGATTKPGICGRYEHQKVYYYATVKDSKGLQDTNHWEVTCM